MMDDRERTPRWAERLAIFDNALDRLTDVVKLSQQKTLSEYERDSLVKRFEFTYEMAWKLMMSYEKWAGINQLLGSRDVVRNAATLGVVTNGEAWMDMIDARNQTSHTYDEEMVHDLTDLIIHTYYPLLVSLHDRMAEILQQYKTSERRCTD